MHLTEILPSPSPQQPLQPQQALQQTHTPRKYRFSLTFENLAAHYLEGVSLYLLGSYQFAGDFTTCRISNSSRGLTTPILQEQADLNNLDAFDNNNK
eukprot:UN10373